jgi:hypothetical protein
MSLSEVEVEELGGEDEAVIATREKSDIRIKRLEEAVRIATEAWNKTRDIDVKA